MTDREARADVAPTWSTRDDADVGVDAPDFGTLAWLRRASGDARLPSWRLTPERLESYAFGVWALARGGPAVETADPGAVLDPERQPLLRPWEYGEDHPGVDAVDPARSLAERLAADPVLAATLRPYVALEEFAATQLRLVVCMRALVLLVGDDAAHVGADRIRAWADAQRPEPGGDADFVASLITAIEGRGEIAAVFGG